MLTKDERQDIEQQIVIYEQGIERSQAAGNQRNAALLAESVSRLQARLDADDRERLRYHRRSAAAHDQCVERAIRAGHKRAAFACETAMDRSLESAGKLAARIEPKPARPAAVETTSSTPAAVAEPTATLNTGPQAGTQPKSAGRILDPRTGEWVECATFAELQQRFFAMLAQVAPSAPVDRAPLFGGFGLPAVFA